MLAAHATQQSAIPDDLIVESIREHRVLTVHVRRPNHIYSNE